jgi:hypothetical protein
MTLPTKIFFSSPFPFRETPSSKSFAVEDYITLFEPKARRSRRGLTTVDCDS